MLAKFAFEEDEEVIERMIKSYSDITKLRFMFIHMQRTDLSERVAYILFIADRLENDKKRLVNEYDFLLNYLHPWEFSVGMNELRNNSITHASFFAALMLLREAECDTRKMFSERDIRLVEAIVNNYARTLGYRFINETNVYDVVIPGRKPEKSFKNSMLDIYDAVAAVADRISHLTPTHNLIACD